MNSLRFERELAQVKGNVFVISPFGQKVLVEGEKPHDFDYMCQTVIKPSVAKIGMTAVRADDIYGPAGLMDVVWRGIQQAEIVIVDFTGKSPNVAFEYALAAAIGKRMVVLTQNKEDVPTDVQGVRYIHYEPDFRGMNELSEELAHHLEAAREEQAVEMCFKPYGGTTPAPGEVVSVEQALAVVKMDDGGYAVLQAADCDYGRLIPDMAKRFKVGDRIEGAYDVDSKTYTLLAGHSNPWPTVESEYEVGRRFIGPVQNKVDGVGVFVKLVGPVKGLVAESSNPEVVSLDRGDQVDVVVTRIDAANRKVQLRLAKPIDTAGTPPRAHVQTSGPAPRTSAQLPALGARFNEAEVVKVAPEGQGGYALVTFPGFGGRAMLHCTRMTDELREDLNSGRLEVGELITVEVYEVDDVKGKVCVRDLPDLDDTPEVTVA